MPLKSKDYKSKPYNAAGLDRTQQNMSDETNINNIVAKFKRTGVLQGARTTPPQFGDFTAVDFQDGLNKILETRETFMSLSARLRSRFRNDPALLLQWLDDPNNQDEAIRLGLVKVEAGPFDPYLTTEEVRHAELVKFHNEALAARQASQKADPQPNSPSRNGGPNPAEKPE